MIEKNPMECIIVETNEVKTLIPVYDENIQENLKIYEKAVGGKFIGWKDPESEKIYKPGAEAYAKPELPFDLFGVECEKGWYPLIQPILDYVKKYNSKNPEVPIIIEQIKEKWARLEIYVDNATPELKKMIDEAKEKASNTCEHCGSTTDIGQTMNYWHTTICKNCLINNSKDLSRTWLSYNDNKIYVAYNGEINLK